MLPSSSPVSLDLSRAISRSTFSLTACSSSALSDVLRIVRKDSLLNIASLHCQHIHCKTHSTHFKLTEKQYIELVSYYGSWNLDDYKVHQTANRKIVIKGMFWDNDWMTWWMMLTDLSGNALQILWAAIGNPCTLNSSILWANFPKTELSYTRKIKYYISIPGAF